MVTDTTAAVLKAKAALRAARTKGDDDWGLVTAGDIEGCARDRKGIGRDDGDVVLWRG